MRRAYLIGIDKYKNNSIYPNLNSPSHDVDKFNSLLCDIGFEVQIKKNISYKEALDFISVISREVDDQDEVIFYYSGHGFNASGQNYITTTDTREITNNANVILEETYCVIEISKIIKSVSKNTKGVNLIILDCCRTIVNNKMSNYSEEQKIPENISCLFAATLGTSAQDGSANSLSLLMKAIDYCFFRPLQSLGESVACIQEFVKYNKIANSDSQPIFFNTSSQNIKLIPDFYSYRRVFENYFKEICSIYKDIKNLIDNEDDSSNISDNIKLIYYLPKDRIEDIVQICIKSRESRMGLMYVLLTIDGYKNCWFDNDRILIASIDDRFRLKIDNDDLYNINDCCQTLENNPTTNKNSPIEFDIELFDNVLHCIKGINGPSIIIKKSKSQLDLTYFINSQRLKPIVKNDIIIDIKKVLKELIQDKKNIAIYGSYITSKEEFIQTLFEYFSPLDVNLILNNDKKLKSTEINMQYTIAPQKQHQKNLDEIHEDFSKCQRAIFLQKAYTKDNVIVQELLKGQMSNSKQIILQDDLSTQVVESRLSRYQEEKFNSINGLDLSKLDAIICLGHADSVGSFLHKIYLKDNNNFILHYNLEVNDNEIIS
ncbi:MAG: caspase family protein [Lachnospiraceae bacterium]|nr:caspase family protein [Lachnospiraceae bacterium]